MPVTAKLSKAFYERLGEEVANELVDWFNAVDATYRSELRELNELNFARFDAKLEQRIAEVKAELRQEIAALKAELLQAITGVRAELREEIVGLKVELLQEIAARHTDLLKRHGDLLKWMFLYWAGTALTVIGLLRL